MVGGDGIRTEYAYDRRHRLIELLKKSAAGALLLAMNYGVDASGLRTDIVEADPAGITRTVAYSYDGVRRLTAEAIDHRDDAHDRSSRWTYDAVGNRLTQIVVAGGEAPQVTTYAYDDNDRLLTELTGAESITYGYDANGNTISKTGPDGDTSYRYDDANRLIEAITPDGITAYVYDTDGLRVRQTHTPHGGTPTTTWYLQDSGYAYAQVIEAWRSEGAGAKRLAATFTFADELVSQTRYDEQGNPSTSFVQMDGFGSTRWVTDGGGNITDSIDYDAFGVEIGRSASAEVEHLYRGERWDANVSAYDLRARLYTPGNGRFLTQDTYMGRSADPASLHKYAYAHGNPVLYSDPSGHMVVLGLDLGGMFTSLGRTIGASTSRVTANRAAGKALERYVESQLQRFVAQHGGQILRQVYFKGPGGVRFADAVVKLGNRFVAIEVKTNLPLGGQALVRLANQIRTFTLGSSPNAALPGTAAEVIVITEQSAAAIEASFLLVESKVATGTLAGVLQGTNGLMTVLRGVLLGL
jgi:RHS repeat-associated protein